MGWLKSESAYDRRIRELEEEADRVRKSMQQLMKGTHRDLGVRADSRSAPVPREPSPLQRPPAYRKTADFRSAVEPSITAEDAGDASAPPAELAAPSLAATTSGRPERLASFLASGSFGKAGSLSRERKIQRNKAIVMLILAVIAVYSLYVWLN